MLKADNIEYYTLDALIKLRKAYDEFLSNSDGVDPDFPLMKFGNGEKKIAGVNKAKIELENQERGIEEPQGMNNFLGKQ